jgi:hypothetical protein
MIKELHDLFVKNDWKWSIKNKGKIVPTQSDFANALDEADRVLYDEKVGTILEVGRLVIIKQTDYLDVYVFVDKYKGSQPKGEK